MLSSFPNTGPPRGLLNRIWWGAVLAVILVALVPWDGAAPGGQNGLAQSTVSFRSYLLVKSAMLWAALGLVAGLAGQGRLARIGALCGVPAALLFVTLVAPRFQGANLVEAFALLPGLALGLWMGERSHQAAATAGASVADFAPETTTPNAALGFASPRPSDPAPRAQAAPATAVRRVLALLLLATVTWTVYQFPVGKFALGIGLAAYLVLLMVFPRAWLAVLPAALPLLDMAFWTGRYFFDEFDMVFLVTAAAWLWRREQPVARLSWPLMAWVLLLSAVVSLIIGILPLAALDENAFSSYWSQYNSLRVGKGFAWGMMLFLMLRGVGASGKFRWLAGGMTLGLVGVSIAALWESWLFTGFGTATSYRVTASFSSMHTGGGHIEAYLVAALPFAWYLAIGKLNVLVRAAAALAFLLGGYALLATVARGGVLAFILSSALLAVFSGRELLRHRGGVGRGGLVMLASGVVVVIAGIAGGVFLQQRIAQTAADAGTRIDHWKTTLRMVEDSPRAWLLGAGLGSFPRQFLFQHPDLALGNYRVERDAGNAYLALNSDGTLYMAQPVALAPGAPYRVELDVRSDGATRELQISLCEKILFNSHRCQWGGVSFEPVAGAWRHATWSFNSGEVGAGNWLRRRPVQLSLYNPAAGSVVGIDNVRLLDAQGRDLVANGNFSEGLDQWFFKSGDHLPWHVKNLWVHVMFEQGVLGLFALTWLVIAALFRLMRVAWRGDQVAATLLAALIALLVVGVVDSLLDAPRLGLLLIFFLLFGAAYRPGLPAGKTRDATAEGGGNGVR